MTGDGRAVYFSGDEPLKKASNFCLVLTINTETFLRDRNRQK
jgi:hypothetical protein